MISCGEVLVSVRNPQLSERGVQEGQSLLHRDEKYRYSTGTEGKGGGGGGGSGPEGGGH